MGDLMEVLLTAARHPSVKRPADTWGLLRAGVRLHAGPTGSVLVVSWARRDFAHTQEFWTPLRGNGREALNRMVREVREADENALQDAHALLRDAGVVPMRWTPEDGALPVVFVDGDGREVTP